jgi:hypothetical protein
LISVAAQIIRTAAADDDFAQEFYEAITADQDARQYLISEPVRPNEIDWLSPSEWLWFAQWRQDLGGPLDPVVLDHLDQALPIASRVFRFDLRGLVMRDDSSNDAADSQAANQELTDIGLRWTERHARQFPDSLEVARDALQYATPAAWYALRILTALDDPRSAQVTEWLDQIAAENGISPEIRRLWRFNSPT